MTLSDVDKSINKTKATISKYEANAQSPTIDMVIVLCKFFNVSADYLIGLVD